MTHALQRSIRPAAISAAIVIATMLTGRSAGGQPPLNAAEAFTRLKGLVGSWDVTERDNPNTKEIATYRLTGDGSVLAEDLRAPGGVASVMGHMYTTYHMDNGRLVLTHFCGAGNQPRMRVTAISDGGRRIAFEMYDITNLATPEAFHSNAVEVIFRSEDRVDLVYRGTRGAAPGTKSEQVFQLRRRQSSF
jgi:hypothetical protein